MAKKNPFPFGNPKAEAKAEKGKKVLGSKEIPSGGLVKSKGKPCKKCGKFPCTC